MMTQTLPIAGKLPIKKALVAKQQPTNYNIIVPHVIKYNIVAENCIHIQLLVWFMAFVMIFIYGGHPGMY